MLRSSMISAQVGSGRPDRCHTAFAQKSALWDANQLDRGHMRSAGGADKTPSTSSRVRVRPSRRRRWSETVFGCRRGAKRRIEIGDRPQAERRRPTRKRLSMHLPDAPKADDADS